MICQTGDRGAPILTMHPDSPVAEAFRQIAGRLVERIRAEAASGPVIRMGP
jgi:Flp pilus assembly CpaE family ATPase